MGTKPVPMGSWKRSLAPATPVNAKCSTTLVKVYWIMHLKVSVQYLLSYIILYYFGLIPVLASSLLVMI